MSLLRRTLLPLALLAGAGLLGAAAAGEQEKVVARKVPAADASSLSARVIVKYRNNASVLSTGRATALSADAGNHASAMAGPQLASTMGARLGVTLKDGRSISPNSQVLTASGMSSQVLADKLAADSDVEWAVVDQRRFALGANTPNDPLYADNQTTTTPVAGQWYLRAPTSSIKSAIDVETAWSVTQGNSNLVVAVLDTGIVKTHPDLASKLVAGYDFISDTTIANDGDGRDSDPSDPGDWVTTTEAASGTLKDCTVEDSSWHGTQTASLIGAATNNGIGMAGVAPNVKLMPVRVLGKCGGYDSDIQAGMRWAAGLSGTGIPSPAVPAKVLNMSLGGSGSCNIAYLSAVSDVTAAGAVVVAAAGNDGLAVGTPANCVGVIGVVGLRHSGTKVGFSDLGTAATIAAPGGNCVNSSGTCVYPIITATNSGTTVPGADSYTDGTNFATGTSFSAPLVAGTAALMMSANPNLTPAQITSLIKSTATAFPGAETGVSACRAPDATPQTSECYCTVFTCGAGMLNAGAAVAAAQAMPPTPVITTSATTVLAGDSITLDGSSSTVTTGRTIASYLWQITSGASLASFSSSTTSASTTLLTSGAGTVTVQLTVTDSSGRTATTTKSFTVAAAKPTVSFTASTTTPVVGTTVTLDGSASKAGTGASLTGYLWEITSGTSLASLTGSATTATTTLSATAAGSVVVRLTVTDSNGYTSSTSQTLTVSASSSGSGSGSDTSGSGGSSSSSSGGGGGAFSLAWGFGLLMLTALLGLQRRSRR